MNMTAHLSEGDGHPADGVVMRSALKRGENGKVHPVLQVIEHLLPFLIHRPHPFPIEDQAGSAS